MASATPGGEGRLPRPAGSPPAATVPAAASHPPPAAFSIAIAIALFTAAPAFAQQPGKFFDTTDRNRDGAISKAEWQTAGRNPQGFAMMDTNRDGKVTRAEGQAAMQKMMEMRAGQQAR